MKKITVFFLTLAMVLSMSAVCFAGTHDAAHKGEALMTYYNPELGDYIKDDWVLLENVPQLIEQTAAQGHKYKCSVDLNNQTLKLSKEIYLDYGDFTLTIKNGTIDAQNKCRILYVNDADTNLYFDDLTLKNGNAKDGAAIYIDDENCTITQPNGKRNVRFEDCKASNCGGAIRISGYGWSSKIYNMTFVNCQASDCAGAIEIDAEGVAIDNCDFQKCKADYYGGAIYIWNDGVTVNKCDFENNQAGKTGKDIYIDDYSTISWNTFKTYNEDDAIAYSKKAYYSRNNNTFAVTSGTSTILSQGTLWIVIGIAVIALAAIAIVFSRKKKNGSAA